MSCHTLEDFVSFAMEPVTITAKTIHSTDGTPIYAEATGNPKNPCVVLIHGLTLSGAVFDVVFADKRLLDRIYMVNP